MVYIKQILVQGFKSYKEQTVIDTFSPKHNVVVGRNGSGKSNFFAAIRFVLSDAYTHMSREERQALLHEGSGSAVMSAYVEIIFDNSDNRFPTGKDEVLLRRTIGLKKDEYSLDKKSATKSDVMNLLEAAGFSRSNPYYIVPQGRVTSLTNAKDSERLALLKEVAGTQVYEQRRTESLKIMDETTQKRNKINDLLKYIDERLTELEEEKEELRDFQEKDKERRCLEYTIYSREQTEINNALEEIDDSRVQGLNTNDDRRETFIQREEQIAEREAEIAALKQQIKVLILEKTQLEQDRREQYKIQTNAELLIDNIEQDADTEEVRAQQLQAELEEVEELITTRQQNLESITPEYERIKQEETETRLQLERVEGQVNHLYSKQGRNARFRNKAERDRFIDKDLGELRPSIEKRQDLKNNLVEEIAAMQEEIARNLKDVEELRAEMDGRKGNLEELSQIIRDSKAKRDELSDRRKELWRTEAKTSSTILQVKENLQKAENVLRGTMDRSTANGLATVKEVANDLGLSGYYGPLGELFEVDDRYRTAVELTAGNSLFHVVVDTDDTATKLLEGINKVKSGRVTFIPLNRVRVTQTKYPEANDAVPMIQKMRFDDAHRPAFEQVFGKTIICPNLETASRYARSEGLSAITLNGDKADRKGALTGGYHDQKKSRLQALKNIREFRAGFERAQAELSSIASELARTDQEVTKAISEIQKAEAKRKTIEENREPLQRSLQQRAKAEASIRETLTKKENLLRDVEVDIVTLTTNIEQYEEEKRSAFKKNLTPAEEDELARLNAELDDLRKQFSDLNAQRLDLEAQCSSIESELRDNLYLKRDRLRGRDLDVPEAGDIETQRTLREKALKSIAKIASKIEKIDGKIEELESDLATQQAERDDLESQNREAAKVIEKQQKGLEKNMQKKTLLSSKKDECAKNIRELGVLPDEAFTKFTNTQSNTLVKKLHKVNEALKKYSHVNKKAFDQYSNFTKQKDQLQTRHAELEESQASIADLIDTLDLRKDEAIERTFKQVSSAFSEIFARLVPGGHGTLIIQRRIDQDEEDEEPSIENYVGVAISVSFNGNDVHRITQLSGGQKSLCALTLIFAIQRCDPAPFYLMDEVDAALDAQYRTAVAQMIHELSATGQFICTTFRPEMVNVADKYFGVFFQNKVSTVREIEKGDALQFIESEMPK